MQDILASIQEFFASIDTVPSWTARYVLPFLVLVVIAMKLGTRAHRGSGVNRTLATWWVVLPFAAMWMLEPLGWWMSLWWAPIAIYMLDTRPRKPRTSSLQQMLDAN